jgi:hypothetical protein
MIIIFIDNINLINIFISLAIDFMSKILFNSIFIVVSFVKCRTKIRLKEKINVLMSVERQSSLKI